MTRSRTGTVALGAPIATATAWNGGLAFQGPAPHGRIRELRHAISGHADDAASPEHRTNETNEAGGPTAGP